MTRSLPPCPASPNCVSTQSTEPSKRMPPLGFEGSLESARRALLDVLGESSRARVVEADERHVRCEFTTLVFRFVDDVEFLFDPEAKELHFRSASRVGHSDLGTNRRRMRKLCRRLSESGPFVPLA